MSDMTTKDEQLAANFARALNVKSPAEAPPSTAGQGPRFGRTGDPNLFRLTLDRIRPDADQVRRINKSDGDPDIRELAESIREHGILEPLNVRWLKDDDIYELIAGERRFTAAKLIGLSDVPVKLVEADAKKARIIQLHENIHRADLQPIELAAALHDLIQGGAKQDELAAMLKKSHAYISKALSVAKGLTTEAKETLKQSGEASVGMDHLYEVSKLPADEQPPMVKRIASENLTRKQLREATSDDKKQRKTERQEKGGRPSKSKPYSKSFGAPNGGKITINFRKAKVETVELIDALRHVLDSLRPSQ